VLGFQLPTLFNGLFILVTLYPIYCIMLRTLETKD